jgi:hypothetical protein
MPLLLLLLPLLIPINLIQPVRAERTKRGRTHCNQSQTTGGEERPNVRSFPQIHSKFVTSPRFTATSPEASAATTGPVPRVRRRAAGLLSKTRTRLFRVKRPAAHTLSSAAAAASGAGGWGGRTGSNRTHSPRSIASMLLLGPIWSLIWSGSGSGLPTHPEFIAQIGGDKTSTPHARYAQALHALSKERTLFRSFTQSLSTPCRPAQTPLRPR